MNAGGSVGLSGTLGLKVLPRVRKAPLSWRLHNLFFHRLRGEINVLLAWGLYYLTGFPVLISRLQLQVHHADGTITDYGTVGRRVVTTVGVNYIVDAFQNTTELENMKFHGFGTGGTAEASGDTGLVTEETTQYNPDNTRPTGSTTEGASANIYRTVGTYSPDSGGTRAITEHGVFSASSAGTLLDRTLFSVVNLVAGSDSLQATYELTFTAGS